MTDAQSFHFHLTPRAQEAVEKERGSGDAVAIAHGWPTTPMKGDYISNRAFSRRPLKVLARTFVVEEDGRCGLHFIMDLIEDDERPPELSLIPD